MMRMRSRFGASSSRENASPPGRSLGFVTDGGTNALSFFCGRTFAAVSAMSDVTRILETRALLQRDSGQSTPTG